MIKVLFFWSLMYDGKVKYQFAVCGYTCKPYLLLHIERHVISHSWPGSEGVIEDVVLLGAPVDGSEKTWDRLSKVVAGKIVNGYCRLGEDMLHLYLYFKNTLELMGFFSLFFFRGDWLLGFVYRSSSVQLSVAGLQPISSNNRHIFNVDLSSVVSKRPTYNHQLHRSTFLLMNILMNMGWSYITTFSIYL